MHYSPSLPQCTGVEDPLSLPSTLSIASLLNRSPSSGCVEDSHVVPYTEWHRVRGKWLSVPPHAAFYCCVVTMPSCSVCVSGSLSPFLLKTINWHNVRIFFPQLLSVIKQTLPLLCLENRAWPLGKRGKSSIQSSSLSSLSRVSLRWLWHSWGSSGPCCQSQTPLPDLFCLYQEH